MTQEPIFQSSEPMKRLVKYFSYKPKIEGVRDGSIRQSIRKGHGVSPGDTILWHGWKGAVRHSKWSWRKRVWVTCVIDIYVSSEEIVFKNKGERMNLDELARLDGIVPPTWEELHRLLVEFHELDSVLVPFQVIRW